MPASYSYRWYEVPVGYGEDAGNGVGVSGPGSRRRAACVWDPVRRESVLFGGFTGASTYLQDTWVYRAGIWRDVTPGSGNPPAREDHTLVWDPVNERVLLWGGYDSGGARADMWAWDGACFARAVSG